MLDAKKIVLEFPGEDFSYGVSVPEFLSGVAQKIDLKEYKVNGAQGCDGLTNFYWLDQILPMTKRRLSNLSGAVVVPGVYAYKPMMEARGHPSKRTIDKYLDQIEGVLGYLMMASPMTDLRYNRITLYWTQYEARITPDLLYRTRDLLASKRRH